jgi:fucose 4-O-acetylase-like acetyltransferase
MGLMIMKDGATRDYYLDNLKFILMACVVIGHALEPLNSASPIAHALYNFIYFFHIPLFVFVTGYFSRKTDKIGGLVTLYVVFESLYTLMDFYLNDRGIIRFTYLTPYWVTWYLLAAILWKIILPYFIRLKYPVLAAGILAVLAGYASKDFGYHLSALRAATFFPFFLAGYYWKKEHLRVLSGYAVRIASAAVLVSALTMLFLYVDSFHTEWLWGSYSNKDIGNPEWYAGMYRIAIYAGTVVLSAAVLALVPRNRNRMSGLGTKTMYPFLLHGFLVQYLNSVRFFERIDTPWELALLVVSALAFTALLSMNWIDKSLVWLFRPQLSFLFKKKDGNAPKK